MIDFLIKFALTQRTITLMLIIGLISAGIYSVLTISADSFPDVSNVQVQIITEPESMATEEVESLVTVPIEYALNGLPFIHKIRSGSEFGLSVVTAIFDEGCDVYFARQLVQQRLTAMSFPPGVPRPQLGPVVSSFSQVFMYYVTSDKHNLIDLRTIQDWTIAKRLLSVRGVGNVVTYGGWIKQYQVVVDQFKLRAYNLTIKDVLDAISASNINAGGNFIESGDEEVIIRGIGRIQKLEDISNAVLKEVNGTPVLVSNVARVEIGPAFRRGSASMNGEGESIIGIVMTRKGANTKEVVQSVEKQLKEIEKTLPKGVKITPFYNQKELVDKTMETVKEILLLSGSLVIIVLAAILMNIRVSLIVALIIPLSLLFSFLMMRFTGLSSNLMTLGAVDFGVVVDAGVVMAENIFRKLSLAWEQEKVRSVDLLGVILNAAQEVGKPITFAIFIIIAVYLPLFTLEGVEGKMFHPLALTFIYALLGALLVALLIIPVCCYWFLKKPIIEKHNPVLEKLKSIYCRALDKTLTRPRLIFLISIGLLLCSFILVPFLGSEFIPSLDEGSIWLRLRMPPSVSHKTTIRFTAAVEKIIRKFPEVSIVVTRVGRSGMGSDIEGVDAADMYIGLNPRHTWKDQNKEHLVERMAKEVGVIPGLMHSFSQPIADMIDDLITGIKADVGIKIFGDDLVQVDQLADRIKSSIRTIRGTGDVSREPILGAPQLMIRLNRYELSRFGLLVDDVQDTIQTAMAGKIVSEVIEGNKRFGVLVRFEPNQRGSEEDVGNILIPTPNSSSIPLKRLAEISVERGALLISRESGQRRSAVMVNIRGRDLGGWVKEAQAKIAKEVPMPQGYSIVWGGQFENQERAMSRLAVVVPIVLLLIFLLLFFTFNSIKNAALIMLNVPFATIGGIIALFLSRQPISVPALIGFIALFGVAVQNGVILISYIMQLEREDKSIIDAIREGASVRFRPVVMTAMVAMMGLLPKLFSEGTGAEIQRPLATVVFGGLLTATAMTLLVLPTLYLTINRLRKPKSESR
ncbi:MAG: CusA/CzcA family heavy metal efflux RND transporter [Candidatus Obscuribacterales bacterium]|nr:CusA/CzcA family heavy metal efflux RND transporter [Candidatus Obscuribacterales bacterium]